MLTIDGKPVPVVGLRYKNVEAALVEVLGIEKQNFPAFQARLRNFRSLIAEVPKTGKGSQIEYDFRQTLIFLLALQLNYFGLSPMYACSYALAATIAYKEAEKTENGDVYVVTSGDLKTDIRAFVGTEQLAKAINDGLVAFFTFNVSERIRSLSAAIQAQNLT